MALPSQLIQSFEALKASPLAAGEMSKLNVRYFVEMLNRAIPTSMNPVVYAVYRFNRTKYITDRERFIQDIKDFVPYEAMILWTDFKDILAFFNLAGKIFLGWDKANNRYRGYVLSQDSTQTIHQPIRILRRGETLKKVTAGESTAECSSGQDRLPYLVVSEPEQPKQVKTAMPPIHTIPENDIIDEASVNVEDVEDDMVRVYDYMQARIARVQQQIADAEVQQA